MNRKDFLKKSFGLGTGCACFFAGLDAHQANAEESDPAATNPYKRRFEFAQTWARRMMKSLDEHLDERTRQAVMRSCGRGCFVGMHGDGSDRPFPDLDQLLGDLRKWAGEERVRRDGNEIYYEYPTGRCLCPLAEDGLKGLSPTYCLCSVGYLREMFSRAVGRPIRVQLLSSLHRGDKFCSFRIDLSE